MKKTGIFYGSTTGTTESVARLIAEKLGVFPENVHDVSKLDAALAESYEALIWVPLLGVTESCRTTGTTALRC